MLLYGIKQAMVAPVVNREYRCEMSVFLLSSLRSVLRQRFSASGALTGCIGPAWLGLQPERRGNLASRRDATP
jgi:hypothetical protein